MKESRISTYMQHTIGTRDDPQKKKLHCFQQLEGIFCAEKKTIEHLNIDSSWYKSPQMTLKWHESKTCAYSVKGCWNVVTENLFVI